MPTTTPWNKDGEIPTGSSFWNLISDWLNDASKRKGIIPVSSDAERDALAAAAPGGVLLPGTTIRRLDRPGRPLHHWTGSAWEGPGLYPVAAVTLDPLYSSRSSSGFQSPGVYRANGRIYLEGTAQNVNAITQINGNQLYNLLTLPAGYAPATGNSAVRFPVNWAFGGTVLQQLCYVQANSDGSNTLSYKVPITITGIAANAMVMPLDGISWRDTQ